LREFDFYKENTKLKGEPAPYIRIGLTTALNGL
jgi:hypothetical protein